MGRIIFNNSINLALAKFAIHDFEFVNDVVGKKRLSEMIYNFYKTYGNEVTSHIN